MRPGFSTVLLLWAVSACSASQDRNHAVRCDQDLLCPSLQVCYRGFCIGNDTQPALDLDAGDLGTTTGNATGSDPGAAASGASDAQSGTGSSSDPSTGTATDPGTDTAHPGTGTATDPGTVVAQPTGSDGGSSTAVDPPTQGPPLLLSDGGPLVPPAAMETRDASMPTDASPLLICVPSCATRSPICLSCLSGVLQRNPDVCTEAEQNEEPLLGALCSFLCTSAACKGAR
jgi:hypothetical protein